MVPQIVKRAMDRSDSGGYAGGVFRVVMRFLQFVFGIAVIGLYAQDLYHAGKANKAMDSRWMYATVIGTFSAVTTIIYMLPCSLVRSWWSWWWDGIMTLFWTVVCGIFGKMFLNQDPKGDSGIIRMKHAVYVDFVNLCLWFTTFVYSGYVFYKHWRVDKYINKSEV